MAAKPIAARKVWYNYSCKRLPYIASQLELKSTRRKGNLSGLAYNTMSTVTPLMPGGYYHIYNRGNNRENIFREARNYDYFLRLYAKYIQPGVDTYAYCLLKNHFHFLIRIKEDLSGFSILTGLSKPFANFFNAYARGFNRAYGRTGALFQRPFGRVLVTTDTHFMRLITYIHQNPQKHRFVSNFREWPYSSYQAYLSSKATHLQRDYVLVLFRGREALEAAHGFNVAGPEVAALAPDDFD